ncbi:hypothetical protein F1559_003423 [Cyanidiococcus yangmingshanensis]|uniref:BZIP domain-containing protein n=1 Tax=Cyanidiococcus yangmingshanensis TaxID=2690220 RepID=A0A7J7IEA2_9RHOD|nr:hypothetical protein F1559_003423 [Cyanidiococcus yangmingshanensis]
MRVCRRASSTPWGVHRTAVGAVNGAVDASMYAATTPTFGVYGGGYIGSGGMLLSPTLLAAAAAAAAHSNSSSPRRSAVDASSPTMVMAAGHRANPGSVVVSVPTHPGPYAITPNMPSHGGEAGAVGPDTPTGASFWIDETNFDANNYVYTAIPNPYGYYTSELPTASTTTTPYAGVSISPLHNAGGFSVGSPYRSLVPGTPHASAVWQAHQPTNGPVVNMNMDSEREQRNGSTEPRLEHAFFAQTSSPDRRLISAWNRAQRREKLERERAQKRSHDQTRGRTAAQATMHRYEREPKRALPDTGAPGISESQEEASENTSTQLGTRSTSERSREDHSSTRGVTLTHVHDLDWHSGQPLANGDQSNSNRMVTGLHDSREMRAQRNREAARRSRLKVKRMITDLQQQNASFAAALQERDREIDRLRQENARLQEQVMKRWPGRHAETPPREGSRTRTADPPMLAANDAQNELLPAPELAASREPVPPRPETALEVSSTVVAHGVLKSTDDASSPSITSDASAMTTVRDALPILSPVQSADP